MEWGEALAKTFLAEVEAFGEDVLFNDKSFKASVGESDESKALEMSGYFQNQSLEIIIPHISLVGLTEAPRVNQTIETRGRGYRIDSVRLLADTQGYALQTELIPQYETTIQEPTIFLPRIPTEVVATLSRLPSHVVSTLLTPLAPSDVNYGNSPAPPTDVLHDSTPIEPDQFLAYRSPVAPYQLTTNRSPLEPNQLLTDRSPSSPDQLVVAKSPSLPDQFVSARSPLEPDQLATDISPIAVDQLSASKFWSPTDTSTELWYDGSDYSEIQTTANVIDTMNDKSGNGYNLSVPVHVNITGGGTINSDTLNGVDCIQTNNTSALQNTNFAFDQNSTALYIAYVVHEVANQSNQFIFCGTSSTALGLRQANRLISLGSWHHLGGSSTGSNITLSTTGVNDGVARLMLVKLNGTNSELWYDGTLLKSGDVGTNAFTQILLMSNEGYGGQLNGKFGEFVAFTTSSDQEKVEGYMAHKWGLESNLPASHTYKSTPPIA